MVQESNLEMSGKAEFSHLCEINPCPCYFLAVNLVPTEPRESHQQLSISIFFKTRISTSKLLFGLSVFEFMFEIWRL